MKTQRIVEIEKFASKIIGDGKTPDLFFVTDQGNVVTITRDFWLAYNHWRRLANRPTRVECALENRNFGVICDISPDSDEPGARLLKWDSSRDFIKQHPQWRNLEHA